MKKSEMNTKQVEALEALEWLAEKLRHVDVERATNGECSEYDWLTDEIYDTYGGDAKTREMVIAAFESAPFERVDYQLRDWWFGDDGVGVTEAPENETEEEKEERMLNWMDDVMCDLGRKIGKIREEIRAWIEKNIEE